jgi:hypothetical protein
MAPAQVLPICYSGAASRLVKAGAASYQCNCRWCSIALDPHTWPCTCTVFTSQAHCQWHCFGCPITSVNSNATARPYSCMYLETTLAHHHAQCAPVTSMRIVLKVRISRLENMSEAGLACICIRPSQRGSCRQPKALVAQGALHCCVTDLPAHAASHPVLSGVSLMGISGQALTADAARQRRDTTVSAGRIQH